MFVGGQWRRRIFFFQTSSRSLTGFFRFFFFHLRFLRFCHLERSPEALLCWYEIQLWKRSFPSDRPIRFAPLPEPGEIAASNSVSPVSTRPHIPSSTRRSNGGLGIGDQWITARRIFVSYAQLMRLPQSVFSSLTEYFSRPPTVRSSFASRLPIDVAISPPPPPAFNLDHCLDVLEQSVIHYIESDMYPRFLVNEFALSASTASSSRIIEPA